MKVEEVMTREVVSCTSDSTLTVAGKQMLEGRFGILPVVDATGRTVGMVTDRDIARAAVSRQRNAAHILVHEVMSGRVTGVRPDEDVRFALKTMVDRCLRRLPVVDAGGLLVGILSVEDLAVRAVGEGQGIDVDEFFNAYKSLCQRPRPESELDLTDTMTPG